MNTKKLLLLLTTSLVLGISLICKDPQPAQAKCKSWDIQCRLQKAGREVDPTNPQSGTRKILRNVDPTNPQSGTREILRNVDPTKIRVEVKETPTSTFNDPEPTPPVQAKKSESCLSVVTDSEYSFLIMNMTSGNVVLMVDNEVHTLRANGHKRFTSQKASGSNECNIKYFPMPIITYHRVSGDIRTLSIGSGIYQFDEVGGETFLVPSSNQW